MLFGYLGVFGDVIWVGGVFKDVIWVIWDVLVMLFG